MAEVSIETIIEIVENALVENNSGAALSSPLTPASAMGDPKEWDSLAFVSVFMAIGEAFDIELEEDDAIHFMSIAAMEAFLNENL